MVKHQISAFTPAIYSRFVMPPETLAQISTVTNMKAEIAGQSVMDETPAQKQSLFLLMTTLWLFQRTHLLQVIELHLTWPKNGRVHLKRTWQVALHCLRPETTLSFLWKKKHSEKKSYLRWHMHIHKHDKPTTTATHTTTGPPTDRQTHTHTSRPDLCQTLFINFGRVYNIISQKTRLRHFLYSLAGNKTNSLITKNKQSAETRQQERNKLLQDLNGSHSICIAYTTSSQLPFLPPKHNRQLALQPPEHPQTSTPAATLRQGCSTKP